jgi:RNA polymerase sigma factor (sigma-70 family)
MAETEQALLEASRRGAREAFAALVERYQGLVCALTFSATGDRALAEDVAQETFLAAWRGLPELREPTRFRAWLCSIARNLSRNARRDGGREVPTAELPEVPIEPAVVDALAAAQQEALVWRTLERLPPTYREPLVLFYREGKSAAEVARALGLSVNAAEQRISRGRKQLEAGVAALVERTLARTRPRAGFVAAVVTAIGTSATSTSAGAAEAAAATPNGSASRGANIMAIAWKTLLFGTVATAIGYGCVAWNEHADEPVAPESLDDSAPAPARRSSAGASVAWSAESVELAERRRRDREGGGDRVSTPRYELTRFPNGQVVVELTGGPWDEKSPTKITDVDGPPPPTARTIRGRVLGRDGTPLADAVVVGSKALLVHRTTLSGQAGATTIDAGSFAMPMPHAGRLFLLALHEQGWSEVATVAAGADDASIDLRLREPARVEGTLARGGEPSWPEATLESEDGSLCMWIRGTEDGRFAAEAVPPGTYTLTVGKSRDAARQRHQSRRIDLTEGATVSWDVDVDPGATLVLAPRIPEGLEPELALHTLVPGPAPHDAHELRARLAEIPPAQRRQAKLLDDDIDYPTEFLDVPRGPAAVCIELVDTDETIAFGCTELDVPAGTQTHEVVVAPKPPMSR